MSGSLKHSRFIEANRRSPVVYGSVDTHAVTYRLADGTSWTFARREAREIGQPRWAHLEEERHRVLIRHRAEERELLDKVCAEYEQRDRYPQQ